MAPICHSYHISSESTIEGLTQKRGRIHHVISTAIQTNPVLNVQQPVFARPKWYYAVLIRPTLSPTLQIYSTAGRRVSCIASSSNSSKILGLWSDKIPSLNAIPSRRVSSAHYGIAHAHCLHMYSHKFYNNGHKFSARYSGGACREKVKVTLGGPCTVYNIHYDTRAQ